MFREMRRFKQALTQEECVELLQNCKRAVIAVTGDEGYPYCLPINYYYEKEDNTIYFHSSKQGHKVDSLNKDNRICFTAHDEGYQKEDWSYYVKSVIVFGEAHFLEEGDKKYEMAKKFGMKYFPSEKEVDEELRKDYSRVEIIAIEIKHMTGKLVHEK